jgi:hypothetical protein
VAELGYVEMGLPRDRRGDVLFGLCLGLIGLSHAKWNSLNLR